MANLKNAKKAIKVQRRRKERNNIIRASVRTAFKKVNRQLEEENKDNIEENAREAIRAIDKAVSKGIIHKNTAARKKSRLIKKVHAMTK